MYMFSNTLINNFMITMSNKNGSILPKKKISKQPPKFSSHYIDKVMKESSAASGFFKLEKLCEEPESKFLQETKTNINETLMDTNKLLNFDQESSSKYLNLGNRSQHPSKTFISQSKKTNEEETELIGMLTRQLYLATNQIQKMQSIFLKSEERLKSKDQEIGALKRKNKDLQTKIKIQESNCKKEEEERRSQIEKSDYLCKRSRTLENRISEMEKFLADYNLVWVGGPSSKSNLSETFSKDYIDDSYSQLKANIKILNLVAGKDEVQVQHNQDGAGAMFKMPKCINLKFYKNGLIVEGGRLRSYSDPHTKCFIRDILDGYFPSEFQNNYPNGVPLKVDDHRKETYVRDGADFPGHGYRLGKQTSSHFKSWTSVNQSANSWPGSALQSPVNTSRDCSFQSGSRDCSSHRGYLQTRRKTDSFTSLDLTNLRSKILASHNNNCSDTHLQSHINAELALSSRRSKVREIATKNTECLLSVREDSNLKCDEKRDSSYSERLSSNCSSSRSKFRSRSADLTHKEKRLPSYQFPKTERQPVIHTINSLKRPNSARTPAIRTPRIMKSVVVNRENVLPSLLQINEPSSGTKKLRLKIRSLSGGTVYLIHISADDTIAKLYQILNKTIMGTRSSFIKYHIVTNGYESKRLDNLQNTLKEYGITRDSVLHLVNG